MQKWISITVFLFLFISANAHQPDISSTMLVEKSDNEWLLQVRSSLTALEYEVEVNYGKDSYASAEEFRSLVLQHMLQHISINANETIQGCLENGKLQLGHESVATFEIGNLPDDLQYLTIQNSSFKDIGRNQSALVILKKGFEREQFVLDNANEHQVRLAKKRNSFALISKKVTLASPYYAFSAVFAFLVLGLFAYKFSYSADF